MSSNFEQWLMEPKESNQSKKVCSEVSARKMDTALNKLLGKDRQIPTAPPKESPEKPATVTVSAMFKLNLDPTKSKQYNRNKVFNEMEYHFKRGELYPVITDCDIMPEITD